MKIRAWLVLIAVALCSISVNSWASSLPKVKMETSMGDIIIELDQKRAPETVKNFLNYVNTGFYDGTVFHRIISNFMIQGGGFGTDYQRKATVAPILNEADNGLSNQRGSIAMARTSDPNSATSQFFINVVDNPNLNFRSKTGSGWGYAVFGKVVEGMDVVDKIRRVPTKHMGRMFANAPQTPVVINKVSVLK